MVVDSNRENLFGSVLPNDKLIEERRNFTRRWKFIEDEFRAITKFVCNDVVAEVNALVANIDTWPSDELLNLLLTLRAETALN
jgi:hypothetical protein